MEINQELLGRVRSEFIDGNLKDKNICIIHDTDCDGLTSAFLITKVLESVGAKPKLYITETSRDKFLDSENMNKIREDNINFIFVADIGLKGSNLMFQYEELRSEGVKFMIFDHHEYSSELSNKDSVYIHPITLVGKEQAAYCTSKLVYDSLYAENNIADLKDYDWVYCTGMLGDMAFMDFKDEVLNIINKYEDNPVEINKTMEYYNTKIGKCIGMDIARSINQEAVHEVYKLLSNSKTPDELIGALSEDGKISEAYHVVNYYLENFESMAEVTGDIIWVEIKEEYKLNSHISTLISQSKPDHTFITYQKIGNVYGLSARRQDMTYSMRDLISKCILGLRNANGGGHIPAAGGRVAVEDFETFKGRVLKHYEDFRIK